jgi:hypothetical protein
MNKIEYRADKDILYISLDGRIDASNASDVEKEIAEIRKNNQGNFGESGFHSVYTTSVIISIRLKSNQTNLFKFERSIVISEIT